MNGWGRPWGWGGRGPWRPCFVRQVHPYFGYLLGGCGYLPGSPLEGTQVLILETQFVPGGVLLLVQYSVRGMPVQAILPKEGSMFFVPRGPRPPWRRPHHGGGHPPHHPGKSSHPGPMGSPPIAVNGMRATNAGGQFCPPGSLLRNGQCTPQMCNAGHPCPPGSSCIGGRCVSGRVPSPQLPIRVLNSPLPHFGGGMHSFDRYPPSPPALYWRF